ncbi:hypothetical protein EJA01_06680 [Rhodovulum iodosum]|uniref:hypothetical protein n=1 Tax=Rhodovulum iodosum TaxID=68291 RepID=UPI000F679EBE|nr:hypothetical protein [Rhodovulum robiginosum]RSK35076.1 hypothetical protein EJA01_06680 [Rhodovulum robiginosum]
MIGALMAAMIAVSLTKPPAEISASLAEIARALVGYAGALHVVFPVVLVLGLVLPHLRTVLFAGAMAFLALSAATVSVIYLLVPNIIAFSAIFVLVCRAYLRGELAFDLGRTGAADRAVGGLALLFGFWYLHWVAAPVWWNALLASPLGVLNCPTLLAICGFLCLSTPPRSAMLTLTAAFVTLYFGIFGIVFLGAYIDVVLVVVALYLAVRTLRRGARAGAGA